MKITRELVEAKIRRLYAEGHEIRSVSDLGATGLIIGEIEIDSEHSFMCGDDDCTVFIKETKIELSNEDGKHLHKLLTKLSWDRRVEPAEKEAKLKSILEYLND